MKYLKLTLLTLTLLSLLTITTSNKAGVKASVNQKTLIGFENKFIPMLVNKFKKIDIPNQSLSVDVVFGSKLYVDLKDIEITLGDITGDNIDVKFTKPNIINVNINDIKAKGKLKTHLKYLFISETDSIDLVVKSLKVKCSLDLTTKESPDYKDKLLPYGHLKDFKLDIDFDFDIHGSIVAKIGSLVKSFIKGKLNDLIHDKAKEIAKEESAELIDDLVSKLTVYVPLMDNGLAVDYSLLSDPVVNDEYLTVNSNGAIVNLNHKETLNPPYNPTDIPDFDKDGQEIQVYLSQYSIDTALYSLFVSDMLKATVDSEDIPEDSPIQLDTSMLDTLIPGFVEKYGKHMPVDMKIKSNEKPGFVLGDGSINVKAKAEITILVRLNDTDSESNGIKQEAALVIDTTLSALADAQVSEDGNISSKIKSLTIKDSTIKMTQIPGANIKTVESTFNFLIKFATPIINTKYLEKIHVDLPSIEGIAFGNSRVDIKKEGYMSLNLTPTFDFDVTFESYWMRRSVRKVERQAMLMAKNEEEKHNIVSKIKELKFMSDE